MRATTAMFSAIVLLVLSGPDPYARAATSSPCQPVWRAARVGPPGISHLDAVAGLLPKDAWAVGYWQSWSGGGYATLAEHWDGSTWNQVPSPSPNVDSNDLVAVSGA